MYIKYKLPDYLIIILTVSCLHNQSSGQEHQTSRRHNKVNEIMSLNTSRSNHKMPYKDIIGVSPDHRRNVVEKHNELRSMEESSNIRRMHWNDILADSAQRHANSCVFEHTSRAYREDFPIFGMIGENMYANSEHFDPEEVVQFWWNEIEYYDYEDNSCSKICLHYTQVVWANSHAIGCGVKYCPQLKKFKYGHGFFVVCQYGPAGNIVGQKPFKKGGRCSECSEEVNFCLDKLCVKPPRADRLRSSKNDANDRTCTWLQMLLVFSCCFLMNRKYYI